MGHMETPTLPPRVRVFLNSAVSYLTLAIVALTAFSAQIGSLFPEGGDDVATWVVRILAWLSGAVLIIRRVSPVEPDQRGMLPVDES